MRTQPRYAVGLIAFAGYLVIVALAWFVLGVDYDTISDSTRLVAKGVVVAVGIGAVFVVVVTTWLGWWRPVLREEPRVAPRWTLVVPVLMALVALTTAVSADYSRLGAGYLAVLAVGVLLVGFSEETVTRGLLLVGFRGSVSEGRAWFWTSLLFGLLHGINLPFGQSAFMTVRQVVMAFLMGTALYVVRMSTGLLVVGMLIHAAWDFGSLSVEGSDASTPPLVAVLTVVTIVMALVAVGPAIRARQTVTDGLPPGIGKRVRRA